MADEATPTDGGQTQAGQEPTIGGGQAPSSTQKPDSDDVAVLKAEVKALRAEAAKWRTELRSEQKAKEALEASQAEAQRRVLEEQGKHKELYEDAKAQLDRVRSTATSKFARLRLESELVGKGLDSGLVKMLNLPTHDLRVTDEFEIEGDLGAAVQSVLDSLPESVRPKPPSSETAPAAPNGQTGPASPSPAASQNKPGSAPTVVTETPRDVPESKVIRPDQIGAEITKRMAKAGLGSWHGGGGQR